MDLAKVYRIETQRLVIRCYEPSDAEMLQKSIAESINHLLPWMPWAKNEPEDLEAKIKRLRTFRGQFDLGQDYVFGIFDKTEEHLIGSTGLHTRRGEDVREIGYWINTNQTNRGFATEAVVALTMVGFEIEQLAKIEIRCDPRNTKSLKIPEKLGFRLEATLKDETTDTNGNLRDVMVWSMLSSDYRNSKIGKIELLAFDAIGRPVDFL